MQKLQLCFLATLAALAILLLGQFQATTAAAAESQFDALKSQFLPAEYKNRNFTVDELKKVLREKCKKAAGGEENSTLYQDIEKGITVLTTCVAGLANVTALQEEIASARPIGELDTVFNKYCDKTPQAMQCLRDFNAKVQPCLSAKEKQQNVVLMRIATGLIDFMCSHGGDHIALFVAEEGPECLEANREAINACLNSSFHERLPKDIKVPDLFDLPELVLEPGHCVDLERFQSCTIHHLEQCREITPANVAESVFKFIKNETSCNQFLQMKESERPVLLKATARNGGVANKAGSALGVLLGSALTLMVSRMLKL
ncbi:27 kDa hemolymph protein-like [Rhagoletis pomonella]|uniref:27 kDa hemolymph protein-like n=1 Tax=Rhagoletis pomonella TaxID=28610 RepID=UPI0017866048|nr:27 kDa hemolymph protein-like [Rhagoletis pomonella]